MTQKVVRPYKEADGMSLDYTPTTAKTGGEVVLLGDMVTICPFAIAANKLGAVKVGGLWRFPKATSVTFTAGDDVYWDTTGTPVSAVTAELAGGAATSTPTSYLIGKAVPSEEANNVAAGDEFVVVHVRSAINIATLSGAITGVTSIAAGDSSLGIAGEAGSSSVGGTVALTGGTGDTGYAGGPVTLTGGTGATTGNGGALTLTGGTPGATSGTGGAVTIVGGGSAAGTNYTGGAVSVTGGAGKGSGSGGAASLVGGVSGATGTGGALTLTSGASVGASGTAGAVAIDCGAATGGTAGAITIGGSNAGSITLGKSPRIPVNASVAVGGTAIGNANAVSEGITIVTGADDTAAVILPVAVAGAEVILISTTASKNLVVFPQVNAAIDALGANNSFNSAVDAPHLAFRATSATQWYCISERAG